jgi:hypothetical protein
VQATLIPVLQTVVRSNETHHHHNNGVILLTTEPPAPAATTITSTDRMSTGSSTSNIEASMETPINFDTIDHRIDDDHALSTFLSKSVYALDIAEKRRKLSPNDDDDNELSNLNETILLEARASPPATPYSYRGDEDEIDTLPISVDGPLPHPSYDLTASLIAQKMSNLSMKEREEVYFDIHGVADVIDETAEADFLDRKLVEMAQALKDADSIVKRAYNMAHSANPSYVDDRDFRLRFLRAERFDAKLAAVRYVRHYETKLELFGPGKIARDIVQEDLGSEALDALYCGAAQILPRRDNAGRLVLFWIPGAKHASYSIDALVCTNYCR